MRRGFAVLALSVVAACADVPSAAPPAGDIRLVRSPAEVWLVVGEEIRVDTLLRIGFTRVVGDSRCPTSVVCVWAGDAEVELAVTFGSGPTHPMALHTTLEPRATDAWGYRLTLVNLSPYPFADPIPADEYALRLRVERLSR